MKFHTISWAAVGAGLALFQGAQAAPIRVTIVTHQEWAGSMPSVAGPEGAVFRMGHAMSGERMLMAPGTKQPGCHMKGGRTSLGDAIRKAMGLPPVQHEPGRFAPMFVVAQPIEMTARPDGEAALMRKPHMHAMHHMGMTSDDMSFLRRVHAALLTLGKWEARAVSFVLGCGIGVLLRMVWVFVVLIFRGVREEPANAADAEYTLVLAHVDEALPKYTDDAQEAAPTYVTDDKSETASGA